jgi:1,4-alpha-glucan branching enzyme
MKWKALIAAIPFFFLSFNYDDAGMKTVYYSSLTSLKQSDTPRNVRLVHSGRRSGQSMLASEGILFTYKNRGARTVSISGNFRAWKTAAMERSDNGVWYYFLPAGEQGREIKYKFMVDGTWIMDPQNPERVDDGMGSYLSVAGPAVKAEGRQVSWRSIGKNSVEFRLWRPGAGIVSLVGDFNHWNPEDDLLSKGRDGIWRLRKKLFPGVYRYKYIIDGEWSPDIYNARSASDDTGETCSIIEIKK